MIRHTDTYTVTQTHVCSMYIHTYFLPAADTDIRTFTDTLQHFKFTGSHIHTHFFYTSTYIHSLSQTHAEPSDIYISTQVFSHSCFIHTQNTMTQIQTHRPRSPGWCYPTSPPVPRVAGFSTEWCPHPCQAGWEGHRSAGGPPPRTGWAFPGEGKERAPAPQLGVREGTPSPSPRNRTTCVGPLGQEVIPSEAAGASGQAYPSAGLSPQPWPPAPLTASPHLCTKARRGWGLAAPAGEALSLPSWPGEIPPRQRV